METKRVAMARQAAEALLQHGLPHKHWQGLLMRALARRKTRTSLALATWSVRLSILRIISAPSSTIVAAPRMCEAVEGESVRESKR